MSVSLTSLIGSLPADRMQFWRGAVAGALVAVSVGYAVAAIFGTRGHLALADALDVFVASAAPALLVVLLLWMARPASFDRRRRRALVGTIIAGAAVVALPAVLFGGI